MGTGKKKRVLEENSRKGENGTKETKSRLLKVEDRERELEQEYMKLKGQSWEGRVGWRDRKHVEAGPGAAGGCGQRLDRPQNAAWCCRPRTGVSSPRSLSPLQGLPQFTLACPPGASSILGGLLLEARVTSVDLVSLVFNLHVEDLVQPRVLSGNL